MPYYRVKVKSFNTSREIWIAVLAEGICEALHKADRFCAYTNHIYYPLEESLHDITEEEYKLYMQLGSQLSCKAKLE
jgi:hypothetical protein